MSEYRPSTGMMTAGVGAAATPQEVEKVVGGGGSRTEKGTWIWGGAGGRWKMEVEEEVGRGGGTAAACSPSALSTAWLGLIFLM